MSKGFKKYLPVWLIFFAAINATAWIMPLIRSKMFWMAYCVVNVAWLVQLLMAYVVLKERKEIATPVFITSFISLIVLFTINAFGLYYFWETWVLALVSMIILAVTYLLMTLMLQNTVNAVQRDENIRRKTDAMYSLIADVKDLFDNTGNKDVYRLYEALRYSDKLSNEKTEKLELQICEKIGDLKNIVSDEQIAEQVDQIMKLLNERNSVSK